jgi:hypothetical protein
LPTTKIVRKPGESVVEFTERAMKEDPDWKYNSTLKALGTSFVKRAKKSDRRRKLEKASRKKNRR